MFEALVARSKLAVTATELFVPLPEHAFARAALSRVTTHAKRTASTSNSLTFLSGPEGSGKSLLARQAIRECLRRQPKLRYLIATALELSELLALAEELQSLTELLDSFGEIDLLVCEDLHDLEGVPARQELLLTLIDHMHGTGPHVLVTSRKLPGELRRLSPRWVSRCHGGLCATLPWPGLDGRRKLIATLVQARHLPLCEPVEPTLDWLAQHWTFSPQEITRSVDRLADTCHSQQAVVELPFLERLLSQQTQTVSLSLDTIATVVAHEFGVEASELRSRSRNQGLNLPRQCAMYLAKELTGRPLELIGGYFGERTHTTVSHSLSRLKERLPQTPSLRQQVQKLRQRLIELKELKESGLREDCA